MENDFEFKELIVNEDGTVGEATDSNIEYALSTQHPENYYG
jgi:hypothetical protein